ncbi:MAG: prenyltransferase/squalene oxidase repeat-containing protein, partial [Blastopirellula sp. JB062]
MNNYLPELTVRIAMGLGEVDPAIRDRHAQFIRERQQADGGFGGREGASDLYYTSFALRSLAILGELHGDLADRACRFLRSRLDGQETIVDFLSLIYGAGLLESGAGVDVFADSSDDWRSQVADALEKLRRDDGGYAKGELGSASSTYHTFLVLLCLQLIERPIPRPDRIRDFLLSQESEEGGFREIRASKRAGTNPTAAAIGALRIIEGLDQEIADGAIDFLIRSEEH